MVKPRFEPADLSWDRNLALLRKNDDGRPLLGRIPLLCRIGAGGMGSVYYGIHPRLDIEVAVKVLPFWMIEAEPELADRFMKEARLAATAKSDHIVQVLDVDEDQGTYFIVMEFVPGVSAAHYLKRFQVEKGTPMPESGALRIVLAATRGLAVAHEKGIVHRDIKPDNILIPENALDDSKLADLGVARRSTEPGMGQETRTVVGTPGFIAPEQALSPENVSPAADVFSMGATLYTLLAGEPPFESESTVMTLMKTVNDEYDPLPASVSEKVRRVVTKCLSKYPAERYENGPELLEVLKGLVSD